VDHYIQGDQYECYQQGTLYCGGYTAKAIITSFGFDTPHHPKELYLTKLGKIICSSSEPSSWRKVFENHGLKASNGSCIFKTQKEKLDFIRECILNNTRIMIRVGKGRNSNNEYSTVRAALAGHWISIWGFNDETKVFYIYDSSVKKKYYSKNLELGNTIRDYEQVINEWKLGWWPYPNLSHYVTVKL